MLSEAGSVDAMNSYLLSQVHHRQDYYWDGHNCKP